MRTSIAISIGIAYSTVLGGQVIEKIMKTLWKPLKKEAPLIRPFGYMAVLMGIVERVIYFTSFMLGYEEFIPIWLALKAAPQLSNWEKGFEVAGYKEISGRVIYNIFLIGNGLSIGFAVMGASLVPLIESGQYLRSVYLASALLAGCGLLWIIIHCLQKRDKTHEEIAKYKEMNNHN
jgi:formate-dependent nitrite reductase membrane component NrfD